jgi:hypothetical protein
VCVLLFLEPTLHLLYPFFVLNLVINLYIHCVQIFYFYMDCMFLAWPWVSPTVAPLATYRALVGSRRALVGIVYIVTRSFKLFIMAIVAARLIVPKLARP